MDPLSATQCQRADANPASNGITTTSRPVSGRYVGEMTSPIAGGYQLDLRLDIDLRYPNSPVMQRVSGDIYRVIRTTLPGRPPESTLVYQHSWIIDEPGVQTADGSVKISGSVRFWHGVHVPTSCRIVVPFSDGSLGPAEVTLTENPGSASTFLCRFESDSFRDLSLEIDVCSSVNTPPLVPVYDTHASGNRPADTPQRMLTIEGAYCEAGVLVTIDDEQTVIADQNPKFRTWSPAELHDALESFFSAYEESWPEWKMWGIMAGTFDEPRVGGIMFDAAAAGINGGSERQGFAVFRKHVWFDDLVPGAPGTQSQAEAVRKFLYTWVHEAGHAFNLLHSWDKARPHALSWMNYDWKYDRLNGTDKFWARFRFRFDDEELIHIRHGDRASVIMGGDPWSSGGHRESPAGSSMSQIEGFVPLEVLIRSKGYFEFMEPVSVEVRLRNVTTAFPIDVDTLLHPAYGNLTVHIRRPDGQFVPYAPVMCKLANPEPATLKPASDTASAEDRVSKEFFLSYGSQGFYFDVPGEYRVRVVYSGPGDLLIPSNVLTIRVGTPLSRDEDRLAQDFFSPQVGMSLYLRGSRSPFLSEGREFLESVADRYKHTMLGAKVATALSRGLARPFFRIVDRQKPVLKEAHAADPKGALDLLDPVQKLYHKDKSKALNLAYGKLVKNRAQYLAAIGEKAKAKKEVESLVKDLAARAVNQVVLDEFETYAQSI